MDEAIESRRLARLLFVALVFVLGFQSMRFLFASLTWYLRDTLGIGVIDLVPISLAPFVLGALLPLVARFTGATRALWLGAVILVGSRIVIQVSTQPDADYWAASLATLAFVGLTPFLFSLGRDVFVAGVLLGLAVDSAIKGLSFSLDLAYRPGWRAVVAVVAIGLAVIWAALQIGEGSGRGVGGFSSLSLLGLAPFLFFQLLILQSQGWVAEVTGVSGPTAMLAIALLNVMALVVASRFQGSRLVSLVAIAAFSSAVFAAEAGAVAFGILFVLAIPLSGVVLAGLLPEPDRESAAASASLMVLGFILFLILGLAYYLPLDLSIGFTQSAVRWIAAGALLGLGSAGILATKKSARIGRNDWMFAGVAALLPAAAFVSAVNTEFQPEPENGGVIRFMSYNIHSAFNVDGALDLEAIARVIEDSEAEVIGLQEVPRGWLLSGTSDMLSLLQLRLGLEHVAYFGTTDPVWGNAILSRYPITDIGTDYLPLVGTPMRRGFLGATVDVGDRDILVISTHLQHINDPDVHDDDPEADLYPVHFEQIMSILNSWGGQSPAVLMGDFNARPDWDQIGLLTDAGWIDSWLEAGSGDGFTSSADNPKFRIDYVFHTADLIAVDAGVFQSTASDHLAVVVDVSSG